MWVKAWKVSHVVVVIIVVVVVGNDISLTTEKNISLISSFFSSS